MKRASLRRGRQLEATHHMRIIFIGDVVGDTGRKALYRAVAHWRAELTPDAVVVNGENAAAGRGLTRALAGEFFEHGVDVITLGDHAWDQRDMVDHIDELPRVLRPFNYQAGTPGCGSVLLPTAAGTLGVLCLMGRTFMRTGPENPYTRGRDEAERLRREGAQAVLVDMHAESTSEKVAMGYHLDGLASAVLGTHTHVPTADARILPGGTAYMTDVGMCGCRDGVIGRDAASVLYCQVSSMPGKLAIGGWPAQVNGALVDVDTTSGRATRLEPLNMILES